jgi:hypothetical protein
MLIYLFTGEDDGYGIASDYVSATVLYVNVVLRELCYSNSSPLRVCMLLHRCYDQAAFVNSQF